MLKIEMDEEVPCLVTTWLGNPKNGEFEDSIERILKILQESGCKKILNDTRKVTLLSLSSQAYVAERVAQFVQENFLFKQANVLSSDAFNRFAVDNFDRKLKAKYPGDPVNAMFASKDEAQGWLEKVKV